jgi:hypothetical protein
MAGLPTGKVGEAYSTDIAALGGGTIAWSVSSGTLPAGLSLSGHTISGTPTTAGNYTFTLMATNANGSDTESYTVTINAAPTVNNGGGIVGGGSSSSTSNVKTTTTGSGSDAVTTAGATVTGTTSNGVQTVPVSGDTMSALTDAAKRAETDGGKALVSIDTGSGMGVTTVGVTIPGAQFGAFASGTGAALQIKSGLGTVSFSAGAVDTIGAAGGDVTVTTSKVDTSTLPDTAKQAVGSHPVYQFSVTSGGKTISQFGGSVMVSVPYTPAAGEDTNAIVIYYIAADGTLAMVPDAHYDTATGMVVFTTTHFSTYAVGYNKMTFTDVSDTAWYASAVTFLAARGITSGTTVTTFSPDATLTRGQFIMMLLRAYGISADASATDNFSDAGNTYYTGYLAAAKRLGITSGVGDNMFAPDRGITRQEMFTLLYSALKATGNLPQGKSGKTTADFSDASEIAPWAKDAMTLLVETGVIGGNAGKLAPNSSTSRAEMAQVLYNLLGRRLSSFTY